MVICSDVSKEHTASIFRVTELAQVDAEVTQEEMCSMYRVVRRTLGNHNCRRGRANRIPPEPIGVDTYEYVSLLGLKKLIT